MRLISAFALTLFLGTASAAWAADAPAPVVKGDKGVAAPVSASGTAEKFQEPNMRLPKDSGGVTNSELVTKAPLKSDFVMGDPKAPLIMIEYASLSCPHCAHFSATMLPQIQKKYIDTGKMRYILRQYPLNEPALKGAMLLQCVGEQSSEKYYVFSKVLFDAQSKWAFDSNFMAGLETIATVGGLSREQFVNCTSNTEREMEALKVKKLASDELKIPHTPFILVGGEAFEGERTPEVLFPFIDKKLNESSVVKKP